MTRADARLRWMIYLTVGAGVAAYCAAEGDGLFALFAMSAWALSWPVSLAPRARPLPRSILTLAVIAALAYSTLRVVNDTQDLVTSVSRLLLWLQVVKLYDRWGPRDRGLLLMMSVFLAIGAVLTSNALLVGASMIVYLPLLTWTALTHELAIVRSRASGPSHDDNRRASRRMRRDLRRVTAALLLGATTVAAGVFVLIPRSAGEGFLGKWGAAGNLRASGFNDSVTLGDAGLITGSRTPVMDVVLRDGSGHNIGSDVRPLLLRGAVLDHYENGRWTRRSDRRDAHYSLGADVSQPISRTIPRSPVLTLDVTMRRRPGDFLFTMLRPISITLERGGNLEVGRADEEIRTDAEGAMRYSIRFQQTPLAQSPQRVASGATDDRVRAMADSLLTGADIPINREERDPSADEAAVRVLVDHLHHNYLYTTEMTAPAANEDPIDMFLFRTKRGHCEYFASGLTSLCRSVGIPARVVTGYLATEFNPGAGAYIVRKSNAHAWVEAQLGDGRWVSFDPSPPEGLAFAHKPPTGFVASMRGVWDLLSRWWVQSVVAFDEERRQALVGRDPLRIERAMQRSVGDALLPTHAGGRPIALIAALRGVVVFAGTAAAGFALVQIAGLLGARLRDRRRRRAELFDDPDAAARLLQRSFYHRALRSLRKAGLEKPRWRPTKDHARALRSLDPPLADAVTEVAEHYYTSRFGRRLLTRDQLDRAGAASDRVRARLKLLAQQSRPPTDRVR